MTLTKYLVAIVGATAVGKTALAIKVAQHFKTEIISADSRQFYREMNIGTAKPGADELSAARHHLVNSHSINEEYNAGQFEKDVLQLLDKLFKTHDVAVMVGGSGLYVDAVCQGMDQMPEVAPALRESLNHQLDTHGLDHLLGQLEQLDSAYYRQVDRANPQRVVRALEVCLSTGLPYSTFRTKQPVQRPFHIIKVGLDREREQLYARIDARMDEMIAAGLAEEARALFEFRHHNALQTVGYREIFEFMEGIHDWPETVRLLKRNSRRYAKRQLTWFRRDTQVTWFEAEQEEAVIQFISGQIAAGSREEKE